MINFKLFSKSLVSFCNLKLLKPVLLKFMICPFLSLGRKFNKRTDTCGLFLLFRCCSVRIAKPHFESLLQAHTMEYRLHYWKILKFYLQSRRMGNSLMQLLNILQFLMQHNFQTAVLNSSMNTLLKMSATAACCVAVIAMLVFIRNNWKQTSNEINYLCN